MFDITDPFGKRRIENLERELRRQKCAMQGEIEYYREKALEQGSVSHRRHKGGERPPLAAAEGLRGGEEKSHSAEPQPHRPP